MRQPVSPMITTRFTTGFGSGRLMPATVAVVAPAGRRNSQVVVVKTDGFELPEVIAAASVVSVLVGRSGRVAGSARTVMALVTPSTVIDGQTGVRRDEPRDGLVVGPDLDPGRIADERRIARADRPAR